MFTRYGQVLLSSARFIRSTTSHQYSYLPYYPKSSNHMYRTKPRTRQYIFYVDCELFISYCIILIICGAWTKQALHKAEALTSQQLHFPHITQMNTLRCAFQLLLIETTLSGGPDTVGSVFSSFHLKTDWHSRPCPNFSKDYEET